MPQKHGKEHLSIFCSLCVTQILESIYISYTLHNEFSYDDVKNPKFGEKEGEQGI